MDQEKVIVIDFGGQYNQLVARRVRECNVYCEIYSYKIDIEKIKEMNPKGIILTGGPNSCYEEDSPSYRKELFELGIPVLGICYGAQFLSYAQGGKVEAADSREYGRANLEQFDKENPLFKGFIENSQVWMSHGDTITAIPDDYKCIASTANVKYAAYASTKQPVWAVQFHPEACSGPVDTEFMFDKFVETLK